MFAFKDYLLKFSSSFYFFLLNSNKYKIAFKVDGRLRTH